MVVSSGRHGRTGVADFVAQLPNPAFVLDGRCRIVEMNSTAEAELTSGTQFRVTGSRVLCGRGGASASRLVQAVAEIVAMKGPLSNGCDIAVLDGSKTTLALFPFSPKAIEGISCWTYRFALLLVRRATAEPQADVWLPYRFTTTERRLSDCISAGKSLRESADALGITYETARTYLKSIFAKAGVRRQAELVALRNRGGDAH
jgi:DNA-binding CsgD family transcriptional regulator